LAAKKEVKNYKEMTAELAEIMEWFESGNIDIDEAMAKYQKAMELINKMENYLKTAENKVVKIASK
jgi:exodeoxyribonuclease VII small subunit